MNVAVWLRRYHLGMLFVWIGLSVPGVLFWKESILFVILLSLYANVAGEFAGYQGARAETHSTMTDEDIERICRAVRGE